MSEGNTPVYLDPSVQDLRRAYVGAMAELALARLHGAVAAFNGAEMEACLHLMAQATECLMRAEREVMKAALD